MKTTQILSLLILATLISGCSRYVWMKPNGDPSTFGPDSYNCKQSALSAAPPTFHTYVPYPQPGPSIVREVCYEKHHGHHPRCKMIVETRDYVPPPQTVDLNANNRDDMYNSCMNANGWVLQRVEEE